MTTRACVTCGNVYDKTIEIHRDGKSYVFDCFECAIHTLAPVCARCRCRIIGHGIEVEGVMFCCANCTRQSTSAPVVDRM